MFSIIKEINFKRHIIGLTLLLLSIIGLGFSIYCFKISIEEHKLQTLNVSNQQSKNSRAQKKLLTFNEFYPQYNQLKLDGIIGIGNRLQWIETLKLASEKFSIPTLNFTLEESKPSNSKLDFYQNANISLRTTMMNINFQILHEGDYYNLIKYLHKNAKGLFSMENCELKLLNNNEYSGMGGTCQLKWFHFDDFTTSWSVN